MCWSLVTQTDIITRGGTAKSFESQHEHVRNTFVETREVKLRDFSMLDGSIGHCIVGFPLKRHDLLDIFL